MNKRFALAFVIIVSVVVLVIVASTVAAQDKYASYTQWQYAKINIVGTQVSIALGDTEDKSIVLDAYNSLDSERRQPFDMIQLMGYIGFELVSVTEQGQTTTFYLKRPLIEDNQ